MMFVLLIMEWILKDYYLWQIGYYEEGDLHRQLLFCYDRRYRAICHQWLPYRAPHPDPLEEWTHLAVANPWVLSWTTHWHQSHEHHQHWGQQFCWLATSGPGSRPKTIRWYLEADSEGRHNHWPRRHTICQPSRSPWYQHLASRWW